MPDNQQYKYEEMSNKVLRADRRLMDTRETDDSTEPESLAGKISSKEMGSRLKKSQERSIPPDTIPSKEPTPQRGTPLARETILESSIEGLRYHPKTQETYQVYEKILTWCSNELGSDVPNDIIRSLADFVLEILKNGEVTDKRKRCEQVMELKLPEEKFHDILSLSKQITDYETEELDENEGVAIDFDNEVEAPEAPEEADEPEAPQEPEQQPQEEPDYHDTLIKSESTEVALQDIDKSWLSRFLKSSTDTDATEISKLSAQVFSLLEQACLGKLENPLDQSLLLHCNSFKAVEILVKNYKRIYLGIQLDRNREQALAMMKEMGISLEEYSFEEPAKKRQKVKTPDSVDLESLVMPPNTLSVSRVNLPAGSFKRVRKSYEEIHVPPPAPPPHKDAHVEISSLPEWCQEAFPRGETATLNRIQSIVYPEAFQTSDNILLCAPTGAGKTNVAMLAILKAVSDARHNGTVDLNAFKVVYVAPLKALVQEQVREFQRRLGVFGIKVAELTGDTNMTKSQIAETQVLVTTPEKWDVVTRKDTHTKSNFMAPVKLLILDEVHLLHDERGPVLENIVARFHMRDDFHGISTRMVALSATLPNYKDVALFLRVPDKGIFFFDSSYRPCPLAQQFIGVTEKKGLKKFQAMNEACYDKVAESCEKGDQCIVFVHSRKETGRTGEWIKDKLIQEEKIHLVMKSDVGSAEILKTEAESVTDPALKSLLPQGIAIHHAGLSRHDRSLSEDLFAAGHVQVLVCTATLAWGVNLPAHTVIIKGTSVYSPEKGCWQDLSAQDVLQMLGRAGRPRYDSSGEGIIITLQEKVQYYLAVLNQQLPIESQLIRTLPDSLNAEIARGTISCLDDAVSWLGLTYLFVRIVRNPQFYRSQSENYRETLAHSALTVLSKDKLIHYNGGRCSATELGRIASDFYIAHDSMKVYNSQLKPHFAEIELLRVFAQSAEFKYLAVRPEEKFEVKTLSEKCPIPVRESVDSGSAKINILLQSYISRLKLEGFALSSDMVYVKQSAVRLLRAIFQICLLKKYSSVSRTALDLCKMVEKRMWLASSPFRQFPHCSGEIVRKTEGSQLPWSHYLQLGDAAEMAQAIRSEKYAREALELVAKFPQVSVSASAVPITVSLLRVDLEITPSFTWDDPLHAPGLEFLVLVEDTDGERVLYQDTLLIRRKHRSMEHYIDFTVPITEPVAPAYFVSLISQHWLQCEVKVPVMVSQMKLPKKFPPPTECLDVPPVPSQSKLPYNKFQSQVHSALCDGSETVFVGCSKGSGKTSMAEMALRRHWSHGEGRAVYLSPFQECIDTLVVAWGSMFPDITVSKLTGDVAQDVDIFNRSHLVLGSPAQLDVMTKRWKKRKSIQTVGLLIADDAHFVGNGAFGSVYETVIARMRFISAQMDSGLRIVALSMSLANGRDFGEWLGADRDNIFNFDVKERVQNLEISISTPLDPQYSALEMLGKSRTLIFVEDRKVCLDLIDEKIGIFPESVADFQNGDIPSLLVPRGSAHLAPRGETVIIMGTQFYEGKEHRMVDYAITDILEMVGCADSRAQLMTDSRKKTYYAKFLTESLPLESHLHLFLHDFFISEIASRVVRSKQDCIDWITFSYFYRRMQQNPSFYHVKDTSHLGVSEFLSELVETTLAELQECKLVELEEDDIVPSNGAIIASHYNISFVTMQTFTLSLNAKSRLKALLEVVTSASEFDSLPIRPYEEDLLGRIYGRVPVKSKDANYESPYFKAFVLVQAHFSRLNLPQELAADQQFVLNRILNLLNGAVDILSTEGYLNALNAMDLSQMIVQAVWDSDSPLKQVPNFDAEVLKRCKESKVDSVFDLMSLEDDERDEILQMSDLGPVAEFVNKFPNVDLSYSVEGTVESGVPHTLSVNLERDEEPEDLIVVSLHYPLGKLEQWWVVVGDSSRKHLYGVRKVSISKQSQAVDLEFTLPDPGVYNLTIWCVCDSYVDADKEVAFELTCK